MNAYLEVKKKALPLVKHYQDDLLKHDRNGIEKQPGVPFLHFARESGTHIVFLPKDVAAYPKAGEIIPYLFGTADRGHILREQRNMVNGISREGTTLLCQYYNGKTVRKIPVDKALEIVTDYVRDMERKFRNENDWQQKRENRGFGLKVMRRRITLSNDFHDRETVDRQAMAEDLDWVRDGIAGGDIIRVDEPAEMIEGLLDPADDRCFIIGTPGYYVIVFNVNRRGDLPPARKGDEMSCNIQRTKGRGKS